jgi:rfaE bifunctional protein nucleotidyltransferase chain/domain
LGKGPNRPLQDEETRALCLASFTYVDAVVLFDDETPENLIKELEPDVLVKGGDYKIEEIAGHEFVQANGGKVLTIPLTEGRSTTNIENKIKNG